MNPLCRSLLILAAAPILCSFSVLAFAGLGKTAWLTHGAAIFLAYGLAWVLGKINQTSVPRMAVAGAIIFALIGLAIPLLEESVEPRRWVSIGPLKLYVAPVLLPSLIAACAILAGKKGNFLLIALAVVLLATLLLAFQPDASQVLGLLVAAGVVVMQKRLSVLHISAALLPLVLATVWTFSRPDPLVPLPHVEEVFAFAFAHSILAGVITTISALALILGLWISSQKGPDWLLAVAAYYAVLFACSTLGLTPAPLIGYGAGPVLGFGLMVGLLGMLTPKDSPRDSLMIDIHST
jgi:cell division protein FtsW (lipid II flippase)